MPRLILNLSIEESEALIEFAEANTRGPREQAALIIRERLAQEGLIAIQTINELSQPQTEQEN